MLWGKALHVMDINGDGAMDVTVAVWDADSIMVLQNDGNQTSY